MGSIRLFSSDGHLRVALYDYDKCLSVLMKRDKMSYEDAVEFLEVNTLGSYVGEKTPAFFFRPEPK